jgi:hypothetical protein
MRHGAVATVVVLVVFLALSTPAMSQGLTLKQSEVAPPEEVVAELRDLLDANAIQLFDGDKPIFEFWFRKDIPLASAPAEGTSALSAIKELTYLGVVRVHERKKDFRNDDIETDVYTMRLGIIPVDGNHLGTTPFPTLAVLVPAKYDEGLDAIPDHDALAEISGQDTYAEHPSTLSLQPLEGNESEGDFPRTGEGKENWKIVFVKVSAKVEGGDAADLAFKLVYEGHGEI